MDLPQSFIEKMNSLLKEEAEAFFDTYKRPKASGLRLNPLKVSQEQWETISPSPLEKIPFAKNGFYYDPENSQPGKHPYHAAGLYYIQEPSAMFVANQLCPAPGERVLDLCAAPGGKTTQLAGMMENSGLLVANEINSKRAKALSENIERMGITNTIVTNENPEKLSAHFEGYFDKILVDAPCSGEGMFRKDEEAIRFWSEEHVDSCARQQKDILQAAYKMLKEDGILVYSTCTFSPEENEQTIERFLDQFPDMELMEIEKANGVAPGVPEWSKSRQESLVKTARLWPHHLNGEGHFTARLKKNGAQASSGPAPFRSNVSSSQLKDFREFSSHALEDHSFLHLFLAGKQLYSLPAEAFDLRGIKVVRAGLHLGEFKKNRFEPNHALALAAIGPLARSTYNLDSHGQEWFHYLEGGTIQTGQDRGWILLTIDGFPLGWGKEAKGTIKNFYPKGLRILR